MEEESFEVTPGLALDVAQTLFIQLAVALNKQGVLSLAALAKGIAAVADENKNDPDRRDAGIALAGIAQGISEGAKPE